MPSFAPLELRLQLQYKGHPRERTVEHRERQRCQKNLPHETVRIFSCRRYIYLGVYNIYIYMYQVFSSFIMYIIGEAIG